MRQEEQVLAQLLDFANEYDSIRAVLLNGSRVNPNVERDLFNDYDVIYAVTDPDAFARDLTWMDAFGERIVMQHNVIDWGGEGHIFLMLFQDGVRIDLSFRRIDQVHATFTDSLTVVLLDKDRQLPQLPPPSDASYVTGRPGEALFQACLNEFWWCAPSVAKGLWRNELPLAKFMLDQVLRDCLINLLSWHAAMHHGWSLNVGKAGRWLERYVPEALWQAYLRTYSGSSYADNWTALTEACQLTSHLGRELALHLGYAYPAHDDDHVRQYIQRVYELPRGASSFV